MKTIVDGKTFNTATSVKVARQEFEDGGVQFEETLYVTRGGAFFVHEIRLVAHYDEETRSNEPKRKYSVQPMTQADAAKWVAEGNGVEVLLEGVLDLPPEAAADAVAERAILVRMPGVLVDRIEKRAKEDGKSASVWASDCLQRCLSPNKDAGATLRDSKAEAARAYSAKFQSEVGEPMAALKNAFETGDRDEQLRASAHVAQEMLRKGLV